MCTCTTVQPLEHYTFFLKHALGPCVLLLTPFLHDLPASLHCVLTPLGFGARE